MAVRTLTGVGLNPNVASTLLVGVGCESVPLNRIADGIARSGRWVEVVTIQEAGSHRKAIERGVRIAREMAHEASKLRRKPFDASHLTIAVKCGGSDATSGIASNPAVGRAMDMLVKEGGTVIFSETTELIGAEHILARRAVNEEVAKRIYGIVNRMYERIRAEGVDIRGSEPTPANIRGGLTTIEEKSLGAIAKGGTSPIQGVLEYGERPNGKGLYIMDSTANTPELIMGFISAGAQIMIFSMGGGLPAKLLAMPAYTGKAIIPILKVTGNPEGFEAVREYFDIYAGTIIEGRETIEEVGRRIFCLLYTSPSPRDRG